MDTEHGTLFFFICFYFYLHKIVAFTSRYVLLSVFWTSVMIRSLIFFLFFFFLKNKKKRCFKQGTHTSGLFPVCINCQSNKRGLASQKWHVHCVKPLAILVDSAVFQAF